MSVLLYGCTIWTPIKHLTKKLDINHTRMLLAVLNKSWKQHPTKQQLYDHLLPILQRIHEKLARCAGPCWGSKDKIISDILQWIHTKDTLVLADKQKLTFISSVQTLGIV